jgi:hypothetical protein
VEKRGRRPVLDKTKRSEVLAIIAMGCSRRTAARYMGCAVSTIQNTADRNRDFAKRLGRAEKQSELSFLKCIHNAAQQEKYWRAAAWALERLNPEDYTARRPDALTAEQVMDLLARVADIITQGVPMVEQRELMIERVKAIAVTYQPVEAEKASEHGNES